MMNKLFPIVLLFCSICFSGENVHVEMSLENRFSPAFAGKFKAMLQGPRISINYQFTQSIVAGIGFGPMIMNGTVFERNDLSVMNFATTDIWADMYYSIHFNGIYSKNYKKAYCTLLLGGRLGKISDNYQLSFSQYDYLTDLIAHYSVYDLYVSSLGPKFMFGLKHLRFIVSGFLNFGFRKEILNQFGIKEVINTSFIASPQFDIGLVVVF